MPNDGAPANAARNADGSLQNPAAWGISAGNGPAGAQPGTFDPNNKPQMDWDALAKTGYGGMYGGMDQGELQGIIDRSKANYGKGILDSNAISYLNNRSALQNMGLVGQGQEADLNALFGGDGPQQNLKFAAFQGGGNGGEGYDVGFQDVNQTTNQNLAKMMKALGGGQGYNLGDYMTGFSGTPNYSMFGGLSASGVANQLRNGNFTDALQSIRQQIGTGNGGQMGANPATNPYSKYETNPFQGSTAPKPAAPGAPTGNGTGAGGGAGAPASVTPGNYANASTAPAGTAGVMNTTNYGTTPAAPITNWNPGNFLSGSPTALNNPGPNGFDAGGNAQYQSPDTPATVMSNRYNPDGSVWTGGNSNVTPPGTRDPNHNTGQTQNGTMSTGSGGGNAFANYLGGQSPNMRGGSGGVAGAGQNYTYNPGGLQAGGMGQGNNSSLSGLGNLYNNLSSGQGVSPTGFGSPNSRRANNSMWGY